MKTSELIKGHINHPTATRSGECSRYTDYWSVLVIWESGAHIHMFNTKAEAINWIKWA